MTDPVLVGKRLSKLREYVRLLRALRERPRAEFASDPFIHGCAERYLQLAIQVMLDIANHADGLNRFVRRTRRLGPGF